MTSTILYIEDNPLNMRLVRRMLQSGGYEMLEAGDATAGMQQIENHSPDLILVDVNLPGIDGLELTRKLKADPQTAHIPIIALTANAMHGDRELCIAAGCDDYLAKPVAKRELQSAVSMHVPPVAAASA